MLNVMVSPVCSLRQILLVFEKHTILILKIWHGVAFKSLTISLFLKLVGRNVIYGLRFISLHRLEQPGLLLTCL